MDYAEHEATYRLFLQLVKYTVARRRALLLAVLAFVLAEAGRDCAGLARVRGRARGSDRTQRKSGWFEPQSLDGLLELSHAHRSSRRNRSRREPCRRDARNRQEIC